MMQSPAAVGYSTSARAAAAESAKKVSESKGDGGGA